MVNFSWYHCVARSFTAQQQKDKSMTEQNKLYTSDSLLSRQEAADFLGIKKHTLEVWAVNKLQELKYVKIGRLVRYRYSDLLAFIERNVQY